MAARFTREEVLDKIFSSVEDENSEVESEDEREKDHLSRWIGSFKGGEGFNSSFFEELTLDVLLPIVRLSSQITNGLSDDQRGKGNILLSLYVSLKELYFIPSLLEIKNQENVKDSCGTVSCKLILIFCLIFSSKHALYSFNKCCIYPARRIPAMVESDL